MLVAQIALNCIVYSSFYVLVASGLALLIGSVKIFTFAHGAMYMLGAYVLYFQLENLHLPYLLAATIAVILVGLFGVMTNRFIIGRLRKQFLVVLNMTLGLSLICEGGISSILGALDRHVTSPVFGLLNLRGVVITWERVVVVVVAAVMMASLFLFLTYTRLGRAIRAVGDNEEAARLQGVEVYKVASLAMFIGTAYAALAGVAVAPLFNINPYMGFGVMVKAIMANVLGGVGNLPGCVLGSLCLGIIDSAIGTLWGMPVASLVSFSIIVLILVIKPEGLLGVEDEL